MGFSWQEYWGGLPFPSPGDLPNPGIEPASPAIQVDSLPSEPPGHPQILGKQHAKIVNNCQDYGLRSVCFYFLYFSRFWQWASIWWLEVLLILKTRIKSQNFFFLFDGWKGVSLVYHLVIFWDQLQCIGRGRILLVSLSGVWRFCCLLLF